MYVYDEYFYWYSLCHHSFHAQVSKKWDIQSFDLERLVIRTHCYNRVDLFIWRIKDNDEKRRVKICKCTHNDRITRKENTCSPSFSTMQNLKLLRYYVRFTHTVLLICVNTVLIWWFSWNKIKIVISNYFQILLDIVRITIAHF